jgi:hypothetical protein
MPAPKKRPEPQEGNVYEINYKRKVYRMIVVSEKGKIGFKVGRVVYSSPTSAAKAVVGKDQEINGPRFWKMD